MLKLVSIIMGVYNCEKTLPSTLDSIISQTYENWELIICDDGSVDGTYKIALEYGARDSRLKILKNDKNIGLAMTLNHCFKYADGEYIMRHDGDDLMTVDRIEKQVKYMEEKLCDVSGSAAYLFDSEGTWGLRMPQAHPNMTTMIAGEPLDHATIIMKREILERINGYTENKRTRQRLEDYDLWIKLYEAGCKISNLLEPLIYYREDKDSYARRKRKYRWAEFILRLQACKRLSIPLYKRIFTIKPLIMMIMPKRILRRKHLKHASIALKKYNLQKHLLSNK